MSESRRPRTRISPSFRCGRAKSLTTATNQFRAVGRLRTASRTVTWNLLEINELQPTSEVVNTLPNPGNEIAHLLTQAFRTSDHRPFDFSVCVSKGATMRLRQLMVSLVAFWIVGVLLPTHADAQFRLRIEDPTTGYGVVVSDQGLGDIGGDQGVIMFGLFGLGGTDTSITIAQGRQAPYDTGVLGDLYLNSVTVSSTGPARLKLTLEDTGYTNGSGWLQLTSRMIDNDPTPLESGYFNAGAGSTVKIQSYITNGAPPALGPDNLDTSVVLPALGSITGTGTAVQTLNPGSSLTGDQSAVFYSTGSYSLFTTVMVELLGTGYNEVSFYQDASVVHAPDALTPEPATFLLISTGLAGLAGARRRRLLNRA